jgi:chemotaxis protein histidine kinase CheA
MGLRAVRDAIAKIGGALTIDSTPGQGTKVDLRLPAASDYGSLSA